MLRSSPSHPYHKKNSGRSSTMFVLPRSVDPRVRERAEELLLLAKLKLSYAELVKDFPEVWLSPITKSTSTEYPFIKDTAYTNRAAFIKRGEWEAQRCFSKAILEVNQLFEKLFDNWPLDMHSLTVSGFHEWVANLKIPLKEIIQICKTKHYQWTDEKLTYQNEALIQAFSSLQLTLGCREDFPPYVAAKDRVLALVKEKQDWILSLQELGKGIASKLTYDYLSYQVFIDHCRSLCNQDQRYAWIHGDMFQDFVLTLLISVSKGRKDVQLIKATGSDGLDILLHPRFNQLLLESVLPIFTVRSPKSRAGAGDASAFIAVLREVLERCLDNWSDRPMNMEEGKVLNDVEPFSLENRVHPTY